RQTLGETTSETNGLRKLLNLPHLLKSMTENIHLSIKRARQKKNFTQAYMAKSLGFKSVSAYSKIETGATELTLQNLSNIARILDSNIITLLSYNEDEEAEGIEREHSNREMVNGPGLVQRLERMQKTL